MGSGAIDMPTGGRRLYAVAWCAPLDWEEGLDTRWLKGVCDALCVRAGSAIPRDSSQSATSRLGEHRGR